MGDMHATFKSSGKMPVSIDLIAVSDSAIMSALPFKSFGDIRSCPIALEVLIFRITFFISIDESLLISNVLPDGMTYVSNELLLFGKSSSKTVPISLRQVFKESAIFSGSVITCSLIISSLILVVLDRFFVCQLINSFPHCFGVVSALVQCIIVMPGLGRFYQFL